MTRRKSGHGVGPLETARLRPEEATWVNYRPKTALGEKLLALRRAYLASGGRLLTAAELDEEMRLRRGGV